MSERLLSPPVGFDELSFEEKVAYIQSLWDQIAVDEARVPVPDWHRDILRERVRELDEPLEEALAWSDVRAGLERDLREEESGQ